MVSVSSSLEPGAFSRRPGGEIAERLSSCKSKVSKAIELKKVIDYAAMTANGPSVLVESILDQAL